MNAKERTEKLTPAEVSDYASFKAATARMYAWEIAKRMNKLTPGLDWRGCTKEHMAEEWATRGRKQHNFLNGLTNEKLRAAMLSTVR